MCSNAIEIQQDIEGDRFDTTDFFFDRIGDSIPIKSDDETSKFDLRNPPSLPLAVSERYRLLVVAHSSGFCVAKTKDVIDAAKEIKDNGKAFCIQELSVVDVPFDKVHMLVLSTDESTLAVSLSLSGHVHFFSLHSLLHKDTKPFSSSSIDESSYVKDIRWTKKDENSFLLLSNLGKLYSGVVDGHLQVVMENVDAVEWSAKGKFVAVAKRNILSILSSKFKERLSISLSFKSLVGDSDVNCSIKVDSIWWIRHDCIVLGCFQLTEDDTEENYLVQVVRSKDGKITDASSKPVVLSFCDLFGGLIDDIVPFGTGPYLFLSYLKQCELAFAANRKNTDQHVVLLGWSLGDEKNDVAVVDIDRDKWLPRIELQDNGDDNLIMGLCIDRVSLYGKVKVQLGVEEPKELSPYCILMCLTLEGKLNMFYVSSVSGEADQPEVVSTLSDEEEDASTVVPVESKLSESSPGYGEPKLEPVAFNPQSQDVKLKELDTFCGIPVESKLSESSPGYGEPKLEPVALSPQSQDVKLKELDTFGGSEISTENNLKHCAPQNINLGQSSLEAFLPDTPSYAVRDSTKAETENITKSGNSGFVGKLQTDFLSLSNQKDQPKSFELAKESMGKFGSNSLQTASFQSWSAGKVMVLNDSDVRSPILPSSLGQGKKYENSGVTEVAANVSGGLVGKPFALKDATATSASVSFSFTPAQGDRQRAPTEAAKIESLPSMHSAQFSSQLNFASGKSDSQKHHPSKDDYRTPNLSGMRNAEPNLSKQSGNIKEMAKELDILLESIQETGGFKDACTVLQKNKVEALEQGLGTLSEQCRIWKSIMDEMLGEVQNLLDKTVQVLARKIYMEGIVKQASDSRYWDLWNRQKLSPELELKRRHILKLNQDLTNQLIELERHFNTIEINKFGENDGVRAGRRVPQSKHGCSRHFQSLHTLQTTMSSQLAVAEQLSECLSKQMAVLSIESPVKKQNVKKELFDTIGIPYDASFSSPVVTKVGDPTSMKKLSLSSDSAAAAAKHQSRRHQSSGMKSYDPETARRRRDSLDRSWASFEPPKTTVKRMLLEEPRKGIQGKSSSRDKQHISPHILEGAAIVRPKDRITDPTSLYPSGNIGIQDTFVIQASANQSTLLRWANDPARPSQSTGLKSFPFQSNIASGLSSLPASQLQSVGGQNHTRETCNVTVDKSSTGVSFVEKSNPMLINKTESMLQSETNINQKPFFSSMLPTFTPSLLKKSSDMPKSSSKGTSSTIAMIGSESHGPTTTKTSTFVSGKISDPQFLSSAAVPSTSTLPARVSLVDVASKSQPGEKASAFPALSTSFSAPSAKINSSPVFRSSLSTSLTTSSSSTSLGGSLTSSKTTLDTQQRVHSISTSVASASPVVSLTSLSASSSTSFSSSSFFSNQATKIPVSLATPSAHVSLTSESPKTELQLPTDKLSSETDVNATTQAPLKLETSVSSVAAVEVPTGLARDQPSFSNMASVVSNVAVNAQPEHSSYGTDLFSSPLGSLPTSASTTGEKNETLDTTVTPEDEMEEEASETSNATELSLGSLDSFAIGSSPNINAPKANPFGGPFGNVATSPASSPFTMTVPSGELFRPASFILQSQSSQPSQPATFSAFSGGFGTGTNAQAPTQTGFGQQAQIGQGQQALGSVLGTFGQSRQIGSGMPGAGYGSPGGFGATSSTGGCSSAATGSGFAGVGSTSGGFGGVASAGGGFASLASGGGFAGPATGGGFPAVASGSGGFAGLASGGGFGGMASASGGFAGTPQAGGPFAGAGGGFGAFSGQQGSAFGGTPGGTRKPPELFTQMRK
ncbi:hypothetical protein Ddye_023329 [Dipteronia dyeriana]|uniref:Nucleoporin Nup159/Nup146 N-terminal domain-containing protein n=1 Tax=Dipteronia dyeriana TaxID=168575 RepID=A0AAD9WSH6_9ROSI|nr:hypothetical protein Ddye_023329 [Dipteronia dyeriana]